MAALAADLEAVHVAVQAAVEKEGSWDACDWSVFVEDVVSFLLRRHKKQSSVVAAAVGLILYGVTNEEELQGVAGQPADQKNFRDTLTADKYGAPAAICDMLFAQYVRNTKRSGSGPLVNVRPVKRALHDGEGRFFASITNLANETGSWRLFQQNIIASRDQPFLYIRESATSLSTPDSGTS